MIRKILGPEIWDAITSVQEAEEEIYLVGGAVRDALLHVPSHDIDFIVKNNTLSIARKCADRLHGHFYALDPERGTGRALVEINGQPVVMDFSTMAPGGIDADLAQRDFTINAIAICLDQPEQLYDPLGGEWDLSDRVLRPCSPQSFLNDPIRTIRAVRFQQRLDLKVNEATVSLIRQAAPNLAQTSAERRRDEIFAIFESKNTRQSCEWMQDYRVGEQLFPRITELDRLPEMAGHAHSLKDHTLAVLDYCQQLIWSVTERPFSMPGEYLRQGSMLLDDFRDELRDYLAHPLHPERGMEGLLYLAVLYHDISKTGIQPEIASGKSVFPQHADKSADIFRSTRENWALSSEEFRFVETLIRNHMLPAGMENNLEAESRRQLFRFFQRSGSTSVLIGIFHLADILATYEEHLTAERWERALDTCRTILDTWFRKHDSIVAPPVLFSGDELMRHFNLKTGPQIGELIADVQENQAAGILRDKEMAFEHIAVLLNQKEASE